MRPHMNIPRIALVLLASLICVGCSDASEEPTPDPTGGGEKVVERYESGQKKFEGYLLEDGTKVGIWTYWYKHGQRKEEGKFKNGKKEGRWTAWHKNGKKFKEGIFVNGEKEGRWTCWYQNGKKYSEGEYKNGKKEGPWPYWFDTGSIHHYTSGIYKDDEKVADLPKKN